jgi:hypothetical protein
MLNQVLFFYVLTAHTTTSIRIKKKNLKIKEKKNLIVAHCSILKVN